MAAEPTCLGAAAITVAEEAGAAVVAAAAPSNDFVTLLSIADRRCHPVATLGLIDLTESVLAAILLCPVLELQDAVNASRSCHCLHDAVQSCEELWARLYEQHFGGSSTSSGGNDSRGTRVAASGRCISSGSGDSNGKGRGSNGKTAEGTYGGGVQVSGPRVGERSGDDCRPRQPADAIGTSRQASTMEPEADSWVSGCGNDGNHGSQRTVMAAPSPPSRPCIGTPQPAVDTDMALRSLDDAVLGVMPRIRVGNTARHGGTSGLGNRIDGDGNVTRSTEAATVAASHARTTAAAAAAVATAAGSTRAAVTGQGSAVAGSGSGNGRGSWQEKFKARYVRESSERRHQRRVKLYRYQAAVQEARSELDVTRRRISDETQRLEELRSQIAELERARQAGIAGSYWVPSAVQQHFSRVVTQGSAVDAAARLHSLRQEGLLSRQVGCKLVRHGLVFSCVLACRWAGVLACHLDRFIPTAGARYQCNITAQYFFWGVYVCTSVCTAQCFLRSSFVRAFSPHSSLVRPAAESRTLSHSWQYISHILPDP
ncbi:hypothetical protein VaNZ11_002284 [Volvox africanus]|uniref:BZIP domain-containing protein n=1 Tax=Volvox africanus TaxID=51714 RepID=A0ABQ5RRP0_9CHLO|nr:hypothetical protein VaNZ11_002284 [Volvox africanus]